MTTRLGEPAGPVLEGAPNFRDLGGLPVAGRRQIRRGVVYRSESFIALTEEDVSRLHSIGVRMVCDLRSATERERHGGGLTGSELIGLIDPTGFDPERDGIAAMDDAASVVHHHVTVYRRYPLSLAATMRQLLNRVMEGRLPAVITCNAGKDRTGVASAILLLALGADQHTVVEDYLRSNTFYGADRIGPVLNERAGRFPPPDAISAFCCNPSYLEETFAAINERGGLDAYLERHLDLTPWRRERLREILTEEALP